MARQQIQDLFLLHTDFYVSEGEIPICGTYITDVDNKILAQFWLCNPNLGDKRNARGIVDNISMVLDAKLSSIKIPRKITPSFLEETALAVVAFLTGHLRESEAGLDRSSLIPSPLWAPQDVYTHTQPPGSDTEWVMEEWD